MTDLSVPDGNDKTWSITITDSNGDAVDITGYTFLFTVKENLSDTDTNAIITKDITSHSNPTGGVTQIIIDRDDTLGNEGKYFFDLQWCDTSNKRRTILNKGNFTITQSVGDREC